MTDLKTVRSILQKYYNFEENPTFIFGSRAMGTHRDNSDLDILIDDRNITPEMVSFVEEAFEESSLLFKVDIVLKSRVTPQFYSQIKSTLKAL